MPSEAEAVIAFRAVTEGDLGTLRTWLGAPHVARWWGDPNEALEEIRQAMAEPSTRPFIVLLDSRPVAYIQDYDMHAEDDHPYRDQPPGTLGIDITIGAADLIGKGVGPRILDAFARRLFAEGAPRVVIDPDPTNAQAIRAYQKAGFREFDRRTTIYGPAVMMARDANDEVRVS